MSIREISQALFSRMLAIRSSSPDSAITKAWDESKYSRQGKGSDKGGEFASKGGGSVSFVAPAIDDPSGSIERDTSKAIRQLDGERHANQKRIMEDIDAQLGIKSTHVNAVGVWSDGAENSLTIRSEGVDHDTLKYATAIKAQIARQKDAIAFTPDENGNAILYTVSVDSRNITELRKAATESGLEYHTIHEDGKKGSKIIVFDPSGSGELDDIVDKFADKMESYHAERTRGQGEFLTNEYASRSKASAKYDEIIGNYEKVFPTRRHYKGETGPGDSDNRRGESTKGLTVGQAQVARALFTRAADICGAGTGAAGGFGSGNRCGSLRNTLKKTIHARVNAEFTEDEQEHLTDGMKPKESAPEHIKDRWYAAALSAEVAWYESERDRTKNALAVEEAKPEIKRNAISVLVNHNSPEIDDKFMRIDAVNETRRARRLSSLKRQVESNEKLLATKQKEFNAAIVAKDRAEVSRARSSMTQSELHSLDSTDVVLAIDDSKENRDFLAQLLAKTMREQQQETASAIFNRAWDESKYNRQAKGSDRGGEFAPMNVIDDNVTSPAKAATAGTPVEYKGLGKTEIAIIEQLKKSRTGTYVIEHGTERGAGGQNGTGRLRQYGERELRAAKKLISRGLIEVVANHRQNFTTSPGWNSPSGELVVRFPQEKADDALQKETPEQERERRRIGDRLDSIQELERKGVSKEDATRIVDEEERERDEERKGHRTNSRTSVKSISDVASIIFTRAWDESKYNRQGKGDDRGGEFAPKQGGGTAAAGPSAKPSKKEVAPGVRLSASGKHLIDSSGGKTKITSDVRREYAASGTPLPTKPGTTKPGNAKPAAPAPVAKNKTPARGGINNKGDDAAHTRLQALRKNLPRGFSLTDYEEEIRLPGGDLLQLNGNSNRAVQQLEDALMNSGHDPNDIVQGINSRELREARNAKVAAKQAATTEKWDGPAALAAQQKLTEIKENLPEDFRMSTTNARQVITPDGDYVTLPDNPAEALKVMEDLLNDHGHDPKTFLQDAKLKAIGADFLDDLEPDENGNLFQKRQSGASYNVENTEAQSWDEVDSYTQNNIEESWRENQRIEIENDSDFYSELRSEAETSADETIDAMDNDEIAAAIHDEIKGMNGFEDFTVEEVEEVLDAGDDKTAQELRDAFVIKHRDELIDKMMEGEFYTEKVSDRINNDEYEMGSDEWFEYAKSNGYLESSEDGGDSEVSDKLDELGLDIDDLTTLMGAPDHWDFNVTYDSEHDGVKCSYEDGRNILIRVFHRNEDGDLAVYNDHFKLDPNAPKGLGLEIFSQSVAACKEQGFVEFKTHAAGSWRDVGTGGYIGFAVWPTFGYSFPVNLMNSDTQSRVADAYPDAEDVRDIFDQPGGQAWWWKNGSSLYNYESDETTYAEFDLRDGSRNVKALNSYMSRKKNERKKVRERMAK
jgi:hypothetical protein